MPQVTPGGKAGDIRVNTFVGGETGETDPALVRLLEKRLGATSPSKAEPEATVPFWDAAYSGLDRVTCFRKADADTRRRILQRHAQYLLTEAWYIENAGMSFAAKMILLSHTSEERRLYSSIAADEARHFHRISAWLHHTPGNPANQPFLGLLDEIISEGLRESLVLIVQVLLEGWGLSHYRSLAEACRVPQLNHLLRDILSDEAGHHGSGLVLCRRHGLPPQQRRYVGELLERFFAMVQSGPQALAAALIAEIGPLTRQQTETVFRELQAEATAATNLKLLWRLLQQTGLTENGQLPGLKFCPAPLAVTQMAALV